MQHYRSKYKMIQQHWFFTLFHGSLIQIDAIPKGSVVIFFFFFFFDWLNVWWNMAHCITLMLQHGGCFEVDNMNKYIDGEEDAW